MAFSAEEIEVLQRAVISYLGLDWRYGRWAFSAQEEMELVERPINPTRMVAMKGASSKCLANLLDNICVTVYLSALGR